MRATAWRKRGVALLEVVVALALLTGTGLALFAWINQSLESASRIARVDSEARIKLDALALLEAVNPALERVGERELAGWKMDWRAQELLPLRRNATFLPGSEGPWWVGLYRLSVSVTGPQAEAAVKFDVVKVGWRKWQAPAPATP
jgi:Tfp pilus assembly protein PilV